MAGAGGRAPAHSQPAGLKRTVESYVKLSTRRKRSDMRQASEVAERAWILAKDLQVADNEFASAAPPSRPGWSLARSTRCWSRAAQCPLSSGFTATTAICWSMRAAPPCSPTRASQSRRNRKAPAGSRSQRPAGGGRAGGHPPAGLRRIGYDRRAHLRASRSVAIEASDALFVRGGVRLVEEMRM